MVDLGEWDKVDYQFKVRETQNKITKEEIQIGKWELDKDEISLKVSNLQLNIDKATSRQEELRDNVVWLQKKKQEK
jgi:hypothetical protein